MTGRRRSEEPRLPPIQHSKIHVKTSQQNSYSFRYYYRIHTKLIQFKHLELSQLSHTTLTKQIMNHATTNCHHIRLNSWWIRILRWCKCCSSLKWLQWLGTRILRWCKCCSPTLSPKWLQWTAAFATVWIYSRCMFITKWYKPLSWCTRQCWRWWWNVTWTGYRWQSQRRLLNITHPLPPLPPVLSTWKDLTAGFERESLGDGYRLSVTKSNMIIEHLLTQAEFECQYFPSSNCWLWPETEIPDRDCVQSAWVLRYW